MASWPRLPSISVWPSGSAFASSAVAMLPPAPGRLSTITCWPSTSVNFGPSRRATISAPPPGANPTRRRSGFVGKSAAETAGRPKQVAVMIKAAVRSSVAVLEVIRCSSDEQRNELVNGRAVEDFRCIADVQNARLLALRKAASERGHEFPAQNRRRFRASALMADGKLDFDLARRRSIPEPHLHRIRARPYLRIEK